MDLVENVDNQALDFLKESLRSSEIKLSAFLNKEVTIIFFLTV